MKTKEENHKNKIIDEFKKSKSHNYHIIINEHHYKDTHNRRCVERTYEDFSDALQRCKKECDEFKKTVDVISKRCREECVNINEEKLYKENGFKITLTLYNNEKYIFITKTIMLKDSIE